MPLRILVVHNRYRMLGGEDSVVATETALLRSRGHQVREYQESNDAPFGLCDAASLFWSRDSVRRMEAELESFRPDLAHFHNVYYRITPTAYWACHRAGVPVIQTLHNFRFGCVNARLNREGAPCERCLPTRLSRAHGVVHRCFQDSLPKSLALTLSSQFHDLLGSFTAPVTKFIALSQCARGKHILSGIPAEKLTIKPNCVYPDPGVKSGPGEYCFFAGRLEVDKGVRVLLEAASLVPDIPIVIAGQGPLESLCRGSGLSNVRYVGPLSRAAIFEAMKKARLLVFPSLAYENFPITIAEAFAVGVPVVASRRGAAEEIVEHTVNGMHFEPGSASSLAECMRAVWRDQPALGRMSASARQAYEQRYSGECTVRALTSIYSDALRTTRNGSIRNPKECSYHE